jgi:proline dehydrogenase
MKRCGVPPSGSLLRHASTSTGSTQPLKAPVFGNPQEVYNRTSTFKLLKSFLVLNMCTIKKLNKDGAALLKKSEKVFGAYLTYNTFLKWTAYSQFCAGETQQQVKSTLKRLEASGIGSILDYAAEAEVSVVEDDPKGPSMNEMIEQMNANYTVPLTVLNENMKHYLLCVVHGSLMLPKSGVGFAAVKVTGLCDPQLLSRVSALLLFVRQQWVSIFTKETPLLEECRVVLGAKERKLKEEAEQKAKDEADRKANVGMEKRASLEDQRKAKEDAERAAHAQKVQSLLLNVDRFASHDAVRRRIKEVAPGVTDAQIDAMLRVWDPEQTGSVDYLIYSDTMAQCLLREGDFAKPSPLDPFAQHLPRLSDAELKLWEELVQRTRCIVATASELRVHVMIDAEQTFFQMAIDHIVRQMQRHFNKNEPIVYNTYQTYLTIMEQRLVNDMARAEREGWNWAGKIVRGAYMKQEWATAKQHNFLSPICETKKATDVLFNVCAKRILQEIEKNPTRKMAVLFGTHNEESLVEITAGMRSMKSHQSYIAFAQLLGMADHLTIPLARADYKVFKYVPYGPIKETIAYLMRRGVENEEVLTNNGSELHSIKRELRRRIGL